MHSNNNLVWFSLFDIQTRISKNEKQKKNWHSPSWWISKNESKKILTFDYLLNIEKRKSKNFLSSPSWWISKNESQKNFDVRHHDEYRLFSHNSVLRWSKNENWHGVGAIRRHRYDQIPLNIWKLLESASRKIILFSLSVTSKFYENWLFTDVCH